MVLRPVADPRVWNSVRWLYVGSGIILLANVGLGILNVFTDGGIPRGQVLAHFHAGAIGWVTLSVIATTLWVFTSDGAPSDGHVASARVLTFFGFVAVAGYITSFYLAFNGDAPFWLLPVFGIPTALVIWGGLLFTVVQWRNQHVVTTVHLLLFGALVVASLGATMGVLWGLTYSTSLNPYPGGDAVEPIGAHAGPMDMYLALAFAGMAELLLRRDDRAPWSKAGMTQMVFGVVSAFLVSAGLYFGVLAIAPVALLLFVGTFVFYFGRVGWRTFAVNPFQGGRAAGVFWGGLAFPVYVGLFVTLVFAYFIPDKPAPHALEIMFVHVTFVGMATNLLLATQSAYARPEGGPGWLEPVGLWVLNLGMLAFFVGEFVDERREGALLMAAGVLMALAAVWTRLGRARHGGETPARAPRRTEGVAFGRATHGSGPRP